METCVINPVQGKGEPLLPAVGILAVNPSDAGSFTALASAYDLRRQFLFHSSLYASSRFFVAGPAVGAPMAAMCLEKCIALGARIIIVYGWCGAVDRRVKVGDILIPEGGISAEGTSAHYPGSTGFAPPVMLRKQVETVVQQQTESAVHCGLVWSTDAVYRETHCQMEQVAQEGVCGVDMEYTGLSAVAAFRGVELAAVMLVSDELYHTPWRPHYNRKGFRSTSQRLLAVLCEAAHSGAFTC